MPNRREHDHIGQFKAIQQKLGIRIGKAETEQIIENLAELSIAGASKATIEKITEDVLKDAKFRTKFIKDYKGAVQDMKFYDDELGW